MKKIIQPKHVLIETVAAEMAAVFYEVGRGQGLTSVHKTAKAYAKHNLEKFIPRAVDTLLDMLKPTSNCSAEMREEIWDALQERLNDPELLQYRPNIDVKKVIKQLEIMERKKGPVVIETKPKTVLHKDNPFRVQRH